MRNLPNWVDAYMLYSNESESPDVYHRWVALVTIAGALRRNVSFDMGYFVAYPNMYVVLVSPPGRGKKSTAMSIGRRILRTVPNIKIGADSISRKQLVVDLKNTKLGNTSALTLFSSELATLLGTSKLEMVVLLTDLFDCPTPTWEHRTETGGIHVIENPFLNLISGTTPDQFAKAMPLDIIGTGLASRIVFVWADATRVRPWRPTLSPAQKELGILLSDDLKHISTLEGEARFAPDAEKLYDEWYQHERPAEMRRADGRTASYFDRKHVHAIKVMMLMSAARQDSLVIEVEDVVRTLDLMRENERGLPYIYGGVGKNPLAVEINEMLVEMISRPEGASRAQLLDKFKYSLRPQALDEILGMFITTKHFRQEGDMFFLNVPHIL